MTGKGGRIQDIAWVGGRFFIDELAALGFRPRHIPLRPGDCLTYADIVERFGGEPDMVVYLDRSMPPPLAGMEAWPRPTAFYCVDSHIHSWYPAYAQGFDCCAVSLRDHMDAFALRLGSGDLLWLPPMARPNPAAFSVSEEDKEYDLLFLGTVDPETTPGRVRFLDALAGVFPELVVRRGDYAAEFPKARLVLNIAERGDLNFRVFEALASGACLLTPEIGHGQDDLFTNGRHLFTYPPDDVAAVAVLARRLLADADLRERTGRAGRALVEARRGMAAGAEAFAERFLSAPLDDVVEKRLASRKAVHQRYLRLVYLHWAEALSGTPLGAAYLKAATAYSGT